MSVTRRNPSVCSETAESELPGGSSESRRVLSELKITGKKKKNRHKKRGSDGLDVTQNQTELGGISPLVHYSPISSAITENCSPSRLSLPPPRNFSASRKTSRGRRKGQRRPLAGEPKDAPETLMEIYGEWDGARWMRPASPPDSRREKKYSLMNSIKCTEPRSIGQSSAHSPSLSVMFLPPQRRRDGGAQTGQECWRQKVVPGPAPRLFLQTMRRFFFLKFFLKLSELKVRVSGRRWF